MIKKKIIFTTEHFDTGGVTTFIASYVNYLNVNGFKCLIYGHGGNIPKEEIKSIFGTSIISELPTKKFILDNFDNAIVRVVFRIRYLIRYGIGFRRIFKEFQPDLIHFNLTWSTLSILLFCPEVLKIPRVITFYGDRALEIESTNPKIAKADKFLQIRLGLIKLIQKLSFSASEKIIVFSQYASNLVTRNFGIPKRKITIIPGVFDRTVGKFKLKDLRYNKKSSIRIINISRFERRKGQDLLIQAIPIILKKGIDVNLTFCGPYDPYLEELFKLVESIDNLSSRVSFLPAVYGQKKIDLIKNHDLFVIPSRELETFGMTILESLSCGVPVIGCPVGAIPEILNKISTKLVAKSVTPEGIAKAIFDYVHLSAKEKSEMQKLSNDLTAKKYTSKKILPDLVTIYSNLLNS